LAKKKAGFGGWGGRGERTCARYLVQGEKSPNSENATFAEGPRFFWDLKRKNSLRGGVFPKKGRRGASKKKELRKRRRGGRVQNWSPQTRGVEKQTRGVHPHPGGRVPTGTSGKCNKKIGPSKRRGGLGLGKRDTSSDEKKKHDFPRGEKKKNPGMKRSLTINTGGGGKRETCRMKTGGGKTFTGGD